MSGNSPTIEEKWQFIKERFLERVLAEDKNMEMTKLPLFWLHLAKAQDRQDYIRKLEIEGYRLAYDAKHGLAAVDRFGKTHLLERVLEYHDFSKLKLEDVRTLPSIEQVKQNFDAHMSAVLPEHLKYIENKGAQQQEKMNDKIYEQTQKFISEKAGGASYAACSESLKELRNLVESKIWYKKDQIQQENRLTQDIAAYKGMANEKTQTIGAQKGKGLSL